MATRPKKPGPKPSPAPLIGGKAQGGHIGPGIYRNAPPDGRLNPPTPWVGKVERGSIYEASPEGPGEFHFQYNPNEMTYNYAFNMELADPSQVASIPTATALGGTTLAFKILLNRQYEVAYQGDSQGVMGDLRALQYLVGMKNDTYSYMLMKTLRFVLGKNHVFYGFINSMSADLGYFSEQMVPMFAVVEISAVKMPQNFDVKTLFGTTPAAEAAAAIKTGSPVTTEAAARLVPTRRTGPAIPSVY